MELALPDDAAAEHLGRHVVAERLVEGVRNAARVDDELGALLWMLVEPEDRRGERLRQRLRASDQHQEEHRNDVGVAQWSPPGLDVVEGVERARARDAS